MNLLELNLPNRGSTETVKVNLRSQAIQHWLSNLPLASPLLTGQKLLEQLRLLNEATIPPDDRFRAMEMLAQATESVCTQIKTGYLEGGLPLSERLFGHALLVQSLMQALADGYKISVMDKLLADVPVGNLESVLHEQVDKALLHAIHRAMVYLGRQLVEHYLVYTLEPAGVWQDLHRLYRFSEKHLLHVMQLQSTPGKPHQNGAAPIIQAYKQIVLLALCNPYHLLQGEADILYRHMSGWAQQVKLLRCQDFDGLQGRFVIDLESDQAPHFLARNQECEAPAAGRVIDVARLLTLLTMHIDTLRGKSTPQGIKVTLSLAQRMEIDMYVRLKRIWSVRLDRLSQRTEIADRITLVTGLSACHHFISGEAEFTPERNEHQLRFASPAGGPAGLSLQPLQTTTNSSLFKDKPASDNDVWLKVFASSEEQDVATANPRAPGFRPSDWRQRNISLGGLSLFCIRDCSVRVRVGEVVAYHQARHAADPWQVGIIRWLRAPDSTGVELGIMGLAQDAMPVAVRALEGIGAGGDYTRALLVPNLDPVVYPTTLLTAAAIYDVGTVLALNMGDRLLTVRLTQLVESTRSFAQYRFEMPTAPNSIKYDPGREARKDRRLL